MAKIPINIATGSLQKEEVIVGIDLGTTNSLVAIVHPDTGKPTVIKEVDNTTLVPSVVYFDHYDNPVIGNKAREMLTVDPQRTIFSSKRLMGKSYNDVKNKAGLYSYEIIDNDTDSLVKVRVGDKFYSPVDFASFILRELKQRAEHILKTPVTKAVITVPAYFNDVQRQATRDAGKLAGLDVLRIINEPTAASLSYGLGLDPRESKIVAVYDMGGGTFDISILHIHDGVFNVLSTHGNTYLGGDDMDSAIVSFWLTQLGRSEKELNIHEKQSIRLLAEEAKKHLTNSGNFNGEFEGSPLTINVEKFNSLIEPIISQTLESCEQALKDSKVTIDKIDSVIMVGGSTRVPLVKEKISNFFNQVVNDSLNPDEVVALGAAVQADVLSGNNRGILLLDITPLSLGLETAGGLMDVLMPRNSKIPSKVARQYTTQVDGQSGMRITVYQGERDLVKDNRKLGEFILSGIPGMPAGLPKVEVSFMIDADSILAVRAKELRSGVEQSIILEPQYGISDSEVEKMLSDSLSHASEDIRSRAIAEARTEGEQLLKTTESFLHKNNSRLSATELLETANAMQALQLAITMDDKDLIHSKIEALNNISRPYAERVMDEAISQALKSTKII